MDKEQKKNNIIGFIVIIIVIGAIFYFTSKKTTDALPEQVIDENTSQEEVKETPTESPDKGASTTDSDQHQAYKDLLNKANDAYLKQDYTTQLSYLQQALKLEQNSNVYRSLYTAHKELKQYEDARAMIKKAVDLSKKYPNHWVEYASFEHLYMKSSFEVVSKIYLDALVATQNHLDLLTAYSAYLVEYKKYPEAITYLEKAIIAYPKNTAIYQAEIDRLKSL